MVELSIGVGLAVAGWALSSALTGSWDTNALQDEVADAMFFTGMFMFISAGVNALKYIYRSDPYPTPEYIKKDEIRDLSYQDMLSNERSAYDGYSKHGWKGNYPGQQRGIDAGGKYLNRNGVLPEGIYHKFDINPAIPVIGRDKSRFVVSNDFVVYLTRDHYVTFYRIIK